MNRIYRSYTIFFFAIILTGLLSASKTSANEGSCYIKAMSRDVYVRIHDLNREGERGPLIWQGRIKQGQEVLIRAPHARFRYFYNDRPDLNQPMSGGNNRWCDSNRTVGVP